MIRRTLLNASAVFALGAASLGASAQTMVLKAADAAGPCPLFAGKLVASAGWCSAWNKKAA